MVNVINRTELE